MSSSDLNTAAIRVMLVDDSAIVRGITARVLAEDQSIAVVASVANGQMAIDALDRHEVDVVVLDIDMPVMDGLTALPKLLEKRRGLRVIMASTLTQRNAGISLQALRLGAADYIPKPSATSEMSGAATFRRDLTEKIKALAAHRLPRATPTPAAPPRFAATPSVGSAATLGRELVDVLVVGASTGGPQALFSVFGRLRGLALKLPVLITQHMPTTFTQIMADHLTKTCGHIAAEGKDGEIIVAGRIYVAPGGAHMVVERRGADKVIRITDDPPENYCRPAVDPLFRSAAAAWGGRVFGIILTGMGSDGAKGGEVIVQAGGTVVAQDEATSVVWGMPGAAARAGICKAVLPINDIGDLVVKVASGR